MLETERSAEARTWYRAGRFPEAAAAYGRALDADPDDVETLTGAGTVALLGNRLDEATKWLEAAVSRSPDHARALQDLAEAAYRRDDFRAAAAWLRRLAALVGEEQRRQIEGVARNLHAFDGRTPYRVEGGAREVRVPFEITDPLPVVNVTLEGGVTVPFFIDTGGHEVFVDQALARDLGLPVHGESQITGAGDKTATIGHGRLPAVTLGDVRYFDLPVTLLDLTHAQIGGIDVRGVIGTAFLYHHLSTIDYPGGALILGPRTPDHLRAFERQASRQQQHVVPFWLSGTHFILSWGTVNGSAPMLLFVDTGGAGIGFTAPLSTIERVGGITLRHDDAYTDHGAGGSTRVVPFDVDELTLGGVTARHVKGVYLPEAAGFLPDDVHEFSVGGIVTHEFFRRYALTFDFDGMRLFLGAPQ